mmetsp:Transcript_8553/g.12611  ORF Transcript_8553/g.12611 Transcript_8553/m.12611 type:complete len:152 (+) Transcript_8553:48-503(+)
MENKTKERQRRRMKSSLFVQPQQQREQQQQYQQANTTMREQLAENQEDVIAERTAGLVSSTGMMRDMAQSLRDEIVIGEPTLKHMGQQLNTSNSGFKNLLKSLGIVKSTNNSSSACYLALLLVVLFFVFVAIFKYLWRWMRTPHVEANDSA